MAIGTNLTGLNTIEIAQQAFNAFASAIAPRAVFSTKVEMTGKKLGDKVLVPFVPNSTATSVATSTINYLASASDVDCGKSIELTNRIYDVVTMPATAFDVVAFQAAMVGKGRSVARKTQEFILAKLAAATFTATAHEVVSELAFVADDLATLNGRSLSWGGAKAAVLSANCHTALTRDREFSLAANYGDSSIVKGGKVQKAYGFEIYADELVSAAIVAEKLVGFVACPQAMGIALAPVTVPAIAASSAALYSGMITDDSGYVLSVKIYFDTNTDQVVGVCEILAGAGVIDASALIRIKTA